MIIESKKTNVTEEEQLNDMQVNTSEEEQFEIWKEFDLQVLLIYFKM